MRNYFKILPFILITIFSCDKQIPEPTDSVNLNDDLNYSCFLNETIFINILENDDIAGKVEVILDDPANGKIVAEEDGLSFHYTPNEGFIGVDMFYYEVCTNSGICDMAKIKIEVAKGLDACDEIFEAQDDVLNLQPNSIISFPIQDLLFGRDSLRTGYIKDIACEGDLSVDFFSILESTSHGSLERFDNQLVYTPNVDFEGEDTFEYQIRSSTNVIVNSSATVHLAVGVIVIIE